MAERVYPLFKIKAGDYLLVSNDQRTLWRIRSYVDGPSYGLDDWSRDRTLWELRCWNQWVGNPDGLTVEVIDDEDQWDLVSAWHERRADAIEAAMS